MVEQVFPSISIGQVPPYRNSFARLPRAQIHKVQPFTFTLGKSTKISRMLTKTKMINFAICPCSPSSTFLFDLLRLVSSEYKTPPKFDLFWNGSKNSENDNRLSISVRISILNTDYATNSQKMKSKYLCDYW